MNNLHLSPGRRGEFTRTLDKRIRRYFKEKGLKRTGGWQLWLKACVMFTLYLGPFYFLLTTDIPTWLAVTLSIVAGVGMAGVGMNVMHDANHGAFSSKSWVNRIMGSSMYLLAGNARNWKVQHNMLHHTYTNVHGYDEDLDAGRIIRFSRFQEWKKQHKVQHIFALFIYGLLTVNWLLSTDFKQTQRYLKRDLHPKNEIKSAFGQWAVLAVSKFTYIFLWLVLPILVSPYSWIEVLVGLFIMHFTASLILSCIFQTAHIMEETLKIPEYDTADFSNTENYIHQLRTTVNFATQNKILRLFAGGLTNQIEHHLFPDVSHVHYPKISKIVQKTADEFNIPYHNISTFSRAFVMHMKYIKKNGIDPDFNIG